MDKQFPYIELVWVDSLGWPVTFFRRGWVRNFIRWALFARGRDYWFVVSDGGLQPAVPARLPDGRFALAAGHPPNPYVGSGPAQ